MSNTSPSHIASTSDLAACWDVLKDTPLTKSKAATFARKRNLSSHDREDVEGDFILEVCKAVRRFDASRSSPKHYTNQVIEKAYLRGCRTHGIATRRPKCVGLDDASNVVSKQSGSPISQNACPQSLRRLVRDLPPELRDLAFELRFKSAEMIAAEEGVHPGTIRRRIERLEEIMRRRLSCEDF
jgi:RNA polymerase sigma factor (sigma-70 family)